MAKDKYYFEIDGEKVLELTPTEIPEVKHNIDMSKKIKNTWDMLYREDFDTTVYIDFNPIVPVNVAQNIYDYMKKYNLLSEDGFYFDQGIKFKVVVQPELPDYAYYFGANEK